MGGDQVTTGLSDKQLQDAHDRASVAAAPRGWVNLGAVTTAGLRAVADLAITHLEAELHQTRAAGEAAWAAIDHNCPAYPILSKEFGPK